MQGARGFIARLIFPCLLLCAWQPPASASRSDVDPPRIVRSGWSTVSEPEEAALLASLRAAKKGGDLDAARRVARALERLRGGSRADLLLATAEPGDRPVPRRLGESEGHAGRWTPDDILVAGTVSDEINPTAAGASTGDLYVSCEYGDAETLLHYRSTDGGESWTPWRGLTAPGIRMAQLSTAIGEGTEDWLLGAYVVDGSVLLAWRESLTSDESGAGVVFVSPEGIAHPRLATDAAEYPAWFAYVAFNVLTAEGWVVAVSRSLDHGFTWEPPVIVGRHCQGWDASESRPDIAFGSEILYVAYAAAADPCGEQGLEIHVARSLDYGLNWEPAVALTANEDPEREPAIAAIRDCGEEPTVIVSYTRTWNQEDLDVWYAHSEDAGDSWETNLCLSCIEDEDERSPDMEASRSRGRVHVGFWRDSKIDYASAAGDEPDSWTFRRHVNHGATASAVHTRPAVGVNPSRGVEEEAGIVWVDRRNWADALHDLYYDGAAVAAGVPMAGAAAEPVPLRCLPNPFTAGTTVTFDLPRPAVVELSVFDPSGRKVRTLFEGERGAGRHALGWEGAGSDGRKLGAGVYYIKLTGEGLAAGGPATLLR